MTRQRHDRDHLLLRVCQLHHEQGLTQQEVGERLHLTRWQVGRLLKEALERGIVRIEIVHPHARSHRREHQMVAMSALIDAVVIPSEENALATRRAVAQAAAEYLADLATKPTTLAVSWGRTMSDLAKAIPPSWATGTTVVQANGGLSRPGPGDPAAIITALAQQSRGSTVFMPAPAIVDSPQLAAALLREPSIAAVVALARSAEVLLFSLGAVSQESVLVESGCLGPRDVSALVRQGAVGDVVGRFLDAEGNPVSDEFESRSVGLSLEDVIGSRRAIAVASGPEKHAIAVACVRRGLCDVLITDDDTAHHVIRRLSERPMKARSETVDSSKGTRT